MITQDVSPGTTTPVHLHENEDELIFIQSGEGEATLGETSIKLTGGSTLFVPQGTGTGAQHGSRDPEVGCDLLAVRIRRWLPRDRKTFAGRSTAES
jgi:uncharacterized cupin superfamily protein